MEIRLNATGSDATSGAPAATPEIPPRPTSPYHEHFLRGALVTVGDAVRAVEDLQTSDFLSAAEGNDDLMLDPSTVTAITVQSQSQGHAVISFTFPSRKAQARLLSLI
ncbi:unnamed protein product, partial [Meganyctiphanes norvegica]